MNALDLSFYGKLNEFMEYGNNIKNRIEEELRKGQEELQ